MITDKKQRKKSKRERKVVRKTYIMLKRRNGKGVKRETKLEIGCLLQIGSCIKRRIK